MIWGFNKIIGRSTIGKIQQVRLPNKGFTLIELMVVMAIVALLMSLVGPLTIQRYEKTRGIEESLSFKNWLVANSYRAFATGKNAVFSLSGNKVTFTYSINNTDLQNLAEGVVAGQIIYEPQLNPIISSREFSYLFFQPQTIHVNAYGIISDKSISMTIAGKIKTMHIDNDSYEYEI
ncbi:MAG: prepilin-type N-terminal cleavage/methylation domain-containing protein [Colwellia sp.]|jgi:prepilin-type N-terminal cleavage/methylation domain-containing protein